MGKSCPVPLWGRQHTAVYWTATICWMAYRYTVVISVATSSLLRLLLIAGWQWLTILRLTPVADYYGYPTQSYVLCTRPKLVRVTGHSSLPVLGRGTCCQVLLAFGWYQYPLYGVSVEGIFVRPRLQRAVKFLFPAAPCLNFLPTDLLIYLILSWTQLFQCTFTE